MRVLIACAFGVLMLLSITACEDRLEEAIETQTTQDSSKIQSEFDDINSTVEHYLNRELSEASKMAADSCPEVLLDWDSKVLTVDYGDGCVDEFGNERTGKIIASYTGPYDKSGSVISVALNGYSVNGDAITGSKVVTNEGIVGGAMRWKIEVSDAQLTTSSGDVITWESTRYRALIDSGSANNPYDQVYHIWGTASGVDRTDRAFVTSVGESSPLALDLTCWLLTRLPVSGTINITPEGLTERRINYGDGDCDRIVTIEVGNQSVELSL